MEEEMTRRAYDEYLQEEAEIYAMMEKQYFDDMERKKMESALSDQEIQQVELFRQIEEDDRDDPFKGDLPF